MLGSDLLGRQIKQGKLMIPDMLTITRFLFPKEILLFELLGTITIQLTVFDFLLPSP